MMEAHAALRVNHQITGKRSCKTSDFMSRIKVIDGDRKLEGGLKKYDQTLLQIYRNVVEDDILLIVSFF